MSPVILHSEPVIHESVGRVTVAEKELDEDLEDGTRTMPP